MMTITDLIECKREISQPIKEAQPYSDILDAVNEIVDRYIVKCFGTNTTVEINSKSYECPFYVKIDNTLDPL